MKKLLLALLTFTFHFSPFNLLSAQTGHWAMVKNLAPHACNGGLVLLTDGRVLSHTTDGGNNGTGWDMLTPDSTGSYVNGTWSSITYMTYDRLFFATQVLPSGKVYVAGGEYGAGGTEGEVYDPVANSWTTCGPIPSGWNIYDGNSEILYNGNVLQGVQIGTNSSFNNLIFNHITLNYDSAPNSIYNHDEASWLKLRDSSILFVGIASPYSNRYIPQTGRWILDDTVPGNLYDLSGEEAGGSFLLPNRKAVFFGATPYNAIYTPTNDTNPGSWASADSFLVIDGYYCAQPDAPSAMLVNGHILCSVSPIGTSSGEFAAPCFFVEYNYLTNTFTQVMDTIPGFGGDSIPSACYQTNMLDLPDGTVLLSNYQQSYANQYYIYTPGSGPIPQGKPTINNIVADGCPNYKITGKLFNGISEGATYGDDWEMETNFPIVRLTNGSQVYYAKTTNWNRIGAVQTDSLEDTAIFSVPPMPGGTYSLVVVANGFASNPVLFTVFGATISSLDNIACLGGTGSITVNGVGGLSPYTYSWAPWGETTATITGLSAGTYTVNITDNNGCVNSLVSTVTQPATVLTATVSGGNAACNGVKDGFGYVSATGGGSPYTYLWSNGKTTTSVSGLSAGTYTISITDNNGCTKTITDVITEPAPLTVITDSTNVTNSANCNGIASVTANGGTHPYTYSWSPGGESTDTIKNQCAGDYCCLVTDNNGCSQTVCVDVLTGIPDLSDGNGQWSVYPNPNNGIFSIAFSHSELVSESQTTIEIYNVLGERVKTQCIAPLQTTIDLRSKPNGVYLVRILAQDGTLIGQQKVVKTQ